MRYAIIASIFVTVLLCFSGSATAADTISNIRETKKITIGYMDSPPFAFKGDDGKVTGFSINLCLKIVDEIKSELKIPALDIRFKEVSSVSRFTELNEGKIDIECGSTTANAERHQKVEFTIPHFYSGVRMIVKRNSKIKNWSDLREKTIAVLAGSTTIKLINARNDVRGLNLKTVEGKDIVEAFGFVDNNRADAFAIDDVLLYNLRATSKNPDDFLIVGEPLSVEPYSIMFRKKEPQLKKIIDQEITKLMLDGDFLKIYNYWFNQPNGPKGINLKMPMGYLLSDSIRFPSDKLYD